MRVLVGIFPFHTAGLGWCPALRLLSGIFTHAPFLCTQRLDYDRFTILPAARGNVRGGCRLPPPYTVAAQRVRFGQCVRSRLCRRAEFTLAPSATHLFHEKVSTPESSSICDHVFTYRFLRTVGLLVSSSDQRTFQDFPR